ncbi:MAG TPA: prolyl oligopeptidase family serine peptidase, partial [Sphingobacteriaceae bacterium]
SYPGAQTFLTGDSMAEYFIWDGIRAVDYLLTRKDVDPKRIGITGRSGGGTQSAIIAAFDDRIKATAPENYITNMKRLYQSMGPQDAEQNFYHWIKRGLDMADLLIVRGPKPTLVITTTRDMFPYQGAMETAAEVSRMYAAYDKPENFQIITDDAAHSTTKKNTERMIAFFQKHLNNPGDSTELQLPRLEPSDMRVTPTGQLATSFKGETTFSLNRKVAETQMEELRSARKKDPAYLSNAVTLAKTLSGYTEPAKLEKPFFTGRAQRDGYTLEKLFITGEGGYAIPYLLMQPVKSNGKALLYIHPHGKKADADVGGDMEWFALNGFTVLSPDIIGTGETGPGVYRGDSFIDSVSYNLWFAAMNVGKSIAGIRAADMVKLAKLLKTDGTISEVYALAKREMAPALLHAAAFDNSISAVAIVQPYSSYRELALTKDYHPDFLHSSVAKAIGKYDLPDLAASLAPKKLLIMNVTDGAGNNSGTPGIKEDLLVIESAYRSNNSLANLQIIPNAGATDLRTAFKQWID